MYSDIVRRHTKVRNSEVLFQQFTGESLENHVLSADWKQIEVRDLCFSYPSQENDGFKNLNSLEFTIHRGEKVAFLGKTGSGKTTTLKLIRGLYTPTQVRVTVDSKEVMGGFGGISNAISLIPQMPEIFATTILRNVTFGVEQSMSEVDRYADICCFLKDVKNLPEGWETHIGERGVNLSGGQQQRLALARGLFASRDKDIILLDEPTSSIDPRLSQVVMERVMLECKQKTVIAVLHNLSLLHHFDRIYIFENGCIVF
jgi:ABC-type multidrug transport system fused ATPase/permease subunit